MQRITQQGIAAASALLGVDERTMRTVMAVESRNSGYDRKGRLLVLYEPHVMWRNLPPVRRETAQYNGLAYPGWGTRPYPADSYPIFERARQFDREAACRSVSMGIGQVLGENYLRCGYRSAVEMYDRLSESEDEQLMAMARFIKSRGLDDELRERKWVRFASVYNGPGYAKNKYHTKLAAAYQRLGRGSPTPGPGRTAADAQRTEARRAVATASTAATGLAGGGAAVAPSPSGHSWMVGAGAVLVFAIAVGAIVYIAMRPARVPRHETQVV